MLEWEEAALMPPVVNITAKTMWKMDMSVAVVCHLIILARGHGDIGDLFLSMWILFYLNFRYSLNVWTDEGNDSLFWSLWLVRA